MGMLLGRRRGSDTVEIDKGTYGGMGIEEARGEKSRQKGKDTGGMSTDLIPQSHGGQEGNLATHARRQMGHSPPTATNREVCCLYLHLRNDVWLFLRLGAKEMVLPALRGICMTYINPSLQRPDTLHDCHVPSPAYSRRSRNR
jgi:hypothetical protein